jgi:hypothetical protein
MNISRYVSPLTCGRVFQGQKAVHRSSRNDVSKIILVGLSSTTLLVLHYSNQGNIDSALKAKHRPAQCLAKAKTLLKCRNYRISETRCDAPKEDVETVEPQVTTAVHYSEAYDPDLDLDSSGYTEEERFYQCVSYHRSLLHDYDRRWGQGKCYSQSDVDEQGFSTRNAYSKSKVHNYINTKSGWPRNVPNADEVAGLECDLFYCQRSPEYQNDIRFCQSTKFRIASYYVSSQNGHNKSVQREKGFRVVKELAGQGYPDAMCLYGKCNEI